MDNPFRTLEAHAAQLEAIGEKSVRLKERQDALQQEVIALNKQLEEACTETAGREMTARNLEADLRRTTSNREQLEASKAALREELDTVMEECEQLKSDLAAVKVNFIDNFREIRQRLIEYLERLRSEE